MQLTTGLSFEQGKEYATREVFGDVLAKLAEQNKEIYALDGDVMNSTFTEPLKKLTRKDLLNATSPNKTWYRLLRDFREWARYLSLPRLLLFYKGCRPNTDGKGFRSQYKICRISCWCEYWRRWSFANGIGRYCFVWHSSRHCCSSTMRCCFHSAN